MLSFMTWVAKPTHVKGLRVVLVMALRSVRAASFARLGRDLADAHVSSQETARSSFNKFVRRQLRTWYIGMLRTIFMLTNSLAGMAIRHSGQRWHLMTSAAQFGEWRIWVAAFPCSAIFTRVCGEAGFTFGFVGGAGI
jgi:hypothetical protein